MTILLSDRRHVARKSHQCSVCLGTIAAGDTYRVQRIVEGGDAWTWKAHLLCRTAEDDVWQDDDRGYDDLIDWDEDIRPRLLAFFTAIAAPLLEAPE